MNGALVNQLGANLAFTKFMFVSSSADDDTARTRLRGVAGVIGRGFFNDFESEGRDAPPQDTIQYFVNEHARDQPGLSASRYAMQISSKYRPRLNEAEAEFRRRLQDATIISMDGAARNPQYTSAEMHAYAYRNAVGRQPGRLHGNVIILPISKTADWWRKHPLERHAYFYPSTNGAGSIKGHARSAHDGIATIYRRLYYNPDGVNRADEFDFITYFECSDEHLSTFDRVRQALQDRAQNPEWEYVIEGPEWRGRRVLKW